LEKGGLFLPTVGIICEYNPLHFGHRKQLSAIRQHFGEDTAIVCVMSGNFVQRGAPAIVDKSLRAAAAIHSGADLVLELPVTYALSSAEGFARGGVQILSKCCDYLCFGAETPDADLLMHTARVLLSDDFPAVLRSRLATGCSFPAARGEALQELGLEGGKKTTDDLNFTVETVSCLGACGLAPAMTVNGVVHPAMTPEKASELIKELRAELEKGGDAQ
jgi:predicted nucleotidyltransferase